MHRMGNSQLKGNYPKLEEAEVRPLELRQRAATPTCAVHPLWDVIGNPGADTRRHKRHNSGDRHRWERQVRQELPHAAVISIRLTFHCRADGVVVML